MHEGALALAEAEMGTAQWRLSRTQVISPTDGRINNLTIRVGDTATVNIPIIGILDAHAWRIISNYKQYYLRALNPGDRVWVWLDSDPWRVHRAHVESLSQGINRDPNAAMLLPYVAPTTDWIRLQRRFPVTIYLDEPPPDGELFMGADARTVIFPH
jgi:multidrug efflux system membrane fusion protein